MSTDRAIALAALLLALASLALAGWFGIFIRRLRRAQETLMSGAPVELVDFAVGMQARQEHVEAEVTRLQGIVEAARDHVSAGLHRRALVRFDAYEHASGRLSSSLALLDESGSGFIVTAIHDRSYARVFVKEVRSRAPLEGELAPEESEAIAQAMS